MTRLRNTRAAAAAAKLGESIVRGDYPPNAKLPVESDLAEQLGIGRNALREAVKVLGGKGLLVTAPRRGTTVASRDKWSLLDPDVIAWSSNSPEFIRELAAFRCSIEPAIAGMAASSATEADKLAIKTALHKMETADTHEKALEADLAFHSAILHASHNRPIIALEHIFIALLRTTFSAAMDWYRGHLPRHREIAEAIFAGDSETARAKTEALAQEHTQNVDAGPATENVAPGIAC